MPLSAFEDALKDYHHKKEPYIVLLEAALEEEATQGTSRRASQGEMVEERKHPNPIFSKAPEIPEISVPADPDSIELARATELIREMRAWAAKSKDKQVKEMLAKMDKELGAHCLPKD